MDPPATLLVLPNGWVKVAAALPYVCGDLRRDTLEQMWDAYRRSWRDAMILSEVNQAIAAESLHPRANQWQSVIGCAIDTGDSDGQDHGGSEARRPTQRPVGQRANRSQELDWETPRMEDVSEQVTAQPYIRFT